MMEARTPAAPSRARTRDERAAGGDEERQRRGGAAWRTDAFAAQRDARRVRARASSMRLALSDLGGARLLLLRVRDRARRSPPTSGALTVAFATSDERSTPSSSRPASSSAPPGTVLGFTAGERRGDVVPRAPNRRRLIITRRRLHAAREQKHQAHHLGAEVPGACSKYRATNVRAGEARNAAQRRRRRQGRMPNHRGGRLPAAAAVHGRSSGARRRCPPGRVARVRVRHEQPTHARGEATHQPRDVQRDERRRWPAPRSASSALRACSVASPRTCLRCIFGGVSSRGPARTEVPSAPSSAGGVHPPPGRAPRGPCPRGRRPSTRCTGSR